jgi:hypothetical protein
MHLPIMDLGGGALVSRIVIDFIPPNLLTHAI